MSTKTLLIVWLFAGLLGATAAHAGTPQPDKLHMRAKRGYLLSLASEHACIRNSTIFFVMQYHARYPQDDVRPFVKVLRDMSVKDAVPQNRLYAFIACTFLENERLMRIAGLPPKHEGDKEAYFARLHEILQMSEALAKE
jgi:hypothetical protein